MPEDLTRGRALLACQATPSLGSWCHIPLGAVSTAKCHLSFYLLSVRKLLLVALRAHYQKP